MVDFEYKESKPVHQAHRLTRQLTQLALRQCPRSTYLTIGSPEIQHTPRLTVEYCASLFEQLRSRQQKPPLDPRAYAYAQQLLKIGLEDTILLFEHALMHCETPKPSTLHHADTIESIAFLAKHDHDAFYRLRGDMHAFQATENRGIICIDDEPVSLTEGCPEVSAELSHHGITVTPTKLFGEFIRWTGGLYIAASSRQQAAAHTAHARKDTPPLV